MWELEFSGHRRSEAFFVFILKLRIQLLFQALKVARRYELDRSGSKLSNVFRWPILAGTYFRIFPFFRPLVIALLCLRDLKKKNLHKIWSRHHWPRALIAILHQFSKRFWASFPLIYSVFNEHLRSTQDVKVLIYICGASQKRGLFCFYNVD